MRPRHKNAVYGWRSLKESRRPCTTPGCPHQTQTEDDRCSECREGRKTFRRFTNERRAA